MIIASVVAFAIVLLCRFTHVETIAWLGLKAEDVSGWTVGAAEDIVSDEGGAACDLARRLGVHPCAALEHVAAAAALAKATCKRYHALRRWNCSSIDLAPAFTPELLTGTREQSFVYALSSAALTYSMAKACSSGALFACTCGVSPRHRPPNGDFKWGGCSDNLKWATRFVRHFLETNATNAIVKRSVKRRKVFDQAALDKKLKRLDRLLVVTNVHNSKAGRKMMERSMKVQCKCHGVSGSCSIRTCWRSLQPLATVADQLWNAVSRSTRATTVKARPWNPRRSNDILYVSPSPNYCAADPTTGSLGTKDRWCNATIRSSEGSCRYMCCGRGFRTYTNESLERCNCKYIWCCRVECDVCKTITDTYYCK